MYYMFPTTQTLMSHLKEGHGMIVNTQTSHFNDLKEFIEWKLEV